MAEPSESLAKRLETPAWWAMGLAVVGGGVALAIASVPLAIGAFVLMTAARVIPEELSRRECARQCAREKPACGVSATLLSEVLPGQDIGPVDEGREFQEQEAKRRADAGRCIG